MAELCRRLAAGLVVAAGLILASSLADACPFCSGQGQTLTGEVAQASMVIFGDPGPITGGGDGQTEFTITHVLKEHTAIKGQTKVMLDRPLAKQEGSHLLVYCDVFKGKIDPYRVFQIKNGSDAVAYIQGALRNKDKKIGERLRFFFDYLDSHDIDISNDAYKEFANASYDDYKTMARSLPADRIAGWLKSKDVQPYRIGLYASMLGHCGNREHAQLLRKILEDDAQRYNSGIDGVFAGYILLEPKEGWQLLCSMLENPRKNDFGVRYAGLRAVRFFWDSRPDVISHEKVREVLIKMLDQSDIADLVIEDLRKWQCWDMTDRVLAVRESKAYEVPIVRRAILRFCLACPAGKNPRAAKHVAEERQKDPEGVEDIEGNLKLEQMPPPAPTPPVKK
jgi:hypothetical protein